MLFSKPNVAAFDFDGTLTYHDTLLSFLKADCQPLSALVKCLSSAPQMLGFVLGLTSRQAAKEALLTQFLSNTPCEACQEKAYHFAKSGLPHLLRPQAIERVRWHQERGDQCLIVSANLGIYLRPWAVSEGFSSVIASELEVSPEGLLTGHLAAPNCWGPEKVKRLEQLLGPRESYYLYAYGDSRGDRELLDYADESYLHFKRIR